MQAAACNAEREAEASKSEAARQLQAAEAEQARVQVGGAEHSDDAVNALLRLLSLLHIVSACARVTAITQQA